MNKASGARRLLVDRGAGASVCLQRDPRAVVVGAAVLVIPLGIIGTVLIEAPRVRPRLLRLAAFAQVRGVDRRSEQADG